MGLIVEPKLNGFRFCIVKEGDNIKALTDGLKDRANHYPEIVADVKKISEDFILDCSMGIERHGRSLPRIQLMTLMADEPKLEEGDVIVCTVFDLPYIGNDIHEKPFIERRQQLEQFYAKHLKASSHFDITPIVQVKTKAEIEKYFKRFGKLPQSEGIMIKDTQGVWPLDGRWDDIAKLKHEAEIKVIAIERHSIKGGNWNYSCGLLPGKSEFENLIEFRGQKYIDLGKCFNTKLQADPGAILTMGVEEIIVQDKKLQWLGARVLDIDESRKEPYAALQVIDIAELANILQKTILQKGVLPGLYLVEPHGRMIREGKKKLIVKTKPIPKGYIGTDVALVEDNVVHGIIRLHEPEEIDRARFKALATEHMISADEAKRWGFSLRTKLYAYGFDVVEMFDKPLGYDPPPGIQTVIREVELPEAVRKQGEETGNITFKVGDGGTGVCQVHLMGLADEEAERLKAEQSRVLMARFDLGRLEAALKSAVGEQAAHLDIRLRRGEEKLWQGGEVFIGNVSGLSKVKDLLAGERKLRAPWKQSRRAEPEVEVVLGPLGWMSAGERKVDLFKPGTPGATANKWGAMVRIDAFKWELYLADEHAKKLRITDARFLDGNWLFAFVPVGGGERIWMVSRLADDDHEKVKKGLSEAERAECDAETERIKENKKRPEASKPHVFRAAKWTHSNGHPRCLVCGDEESIGKVCNMPDDWYHKHEWDDEGAWAEERKRLRSDGVVKMADAGGAVFRFLKIDKKQQMVGGVVYAPDELDTQGDWTDAEEIQQGMYRFMLKYAQDTNRIKVLHKGKPRFFPVLECFQPEHDMRVGGQVIKAGSWWMMVKVTDPDVWAEVEAGRLTGFSMGGRASESPPK